MTISTDRISDLQTTYRCITYRTELSVCLILIFSRATVRNPTYLDTTDIAYCIIPYSRKSYNQL